MKKALLASLILHLLPLLFLRPKVDPENKEEYKQASGGKEQDAKKTTGFDVQVIEQVPSGGEKKEAKNFYFGLGISGQYLTTEMGQVYQIDTVYSGYNGEAAGLQPGDYIVNVNGQSPVVNDISGDGPLVLTLVVIRANINMVIVTKRSKVFY